MSTSSPNEQDRAELERFWLYSRLVWAAQQAGVPGDEAQRAIYPDVYPDGPHWSKPEGSR